MVCFYRFFCFSMRKFVWFWIIGFWCLVCWKKSLRSFLRNFKPSIARRQLCLKFCICNNFLKYPTNCQEDWPSPRWTLRFVGYSKSVEKILDLKSDSCLSLFNTYFFHYLFSFLYWLRFYSFSLKNMTFNSIIANCNEEKIRKFQCDCNQLTDWLHWKFDSD